MKNYLLRTVPSVFFAFCFASLMISCGVPDQNSETSDEQVSFIQLPSSGPGYYAFVKDDRLWGTKTTIENFQKTSSEWKLLGYDQAYSRIGVNDISFQDGRKMDPHASHKTGKDIDLRPMRNDGQEAATEVAASSFSHDGSLLLIKTVKKNFDLRLIFFNDPMIYISGQAQCANPDASGEKLSYVQCWEGHHNHIHVSSK